MSSCLQRPGLQLRGRAWCRVVAPAAERVAVCCNVCCVSLSTRCGVHFRPNDGNKSVVILYKFYYKIDST